MNSNDFYKVVFEKWTMTWGQKTLHIGYMIEFSYPVETIVQIECGDIVLAEAMGINKAMRQFGPGHDWENVKYRTNVYTYSTDM